MHRTSTSCGQGQVLCGVLINLLPWLKEKRHKTTAGGATGVRKALSKKSTLCGSCWTFHLKDGHEGLQNGVMWCYCPLCSGKGDQVVKVGCFVLFWSPSGSSCRQGEGLGSDLGTLVRKGQSNAACLPWLQLFGAAEKGSLRADVQEFFSTLSSCKCKPSLGSGCCCSWCRAGEAGCFPSHLSVSRGGWWVCGCIPADYLSTAWLSDKAFGVENTLLWVLGGIKCHPFLYQETQAHSAALVAFCYLTVK